ncbi:MAG: hypothetical protein QM802_04830 [Agriterribacter sp.]
MTLVLITAFDSPPSAESCQRTLPGRDSAERRNAIALVWLKTQPTLPNQR